jgi:hypothetical protein
MARKPILTYMSCWIGSLAKEVWGLLWFAGVGDLFASHGSFCVSYGCWHTEYVLCQGATWTLACLVQTDLVYCHGWSFW